MQEDFKPPRLSCSAAIDHRFHKVELAIQGHFTPGGVFQQKTEIRGGQAYRLVRSRAQAAPGKTVDGCVQHASTFLARIRRYISSTAGETDAQWRFCSNFHTLCPHGKLSRPHLY